LEDAAFLLALVALASEVGDPKMGNETEEGDDDGEVADEEVDCLVVVLVKARVACGRRTLTTFRPHR
jgi:hypothetical protein